VGGPNAGGACDPLAPDPGFPMADPCAGSLCQSRSVPAAGDCDGNGAVSIDELVLGVDIALGRQPVTPCPPFHPHHAGPLAADEWLGPTPSELTPLRDAEASPLYPTCTYAAPGVLELTPPLQMASPGAAATARTLTYCALYDNGFTNPSEVKRNSTVPTNGAP